MNIWFIISIILFVICMILIIKIYLNNKDIKKIGENLEEILTNDTNNLITVSTSNKQIKKVAGKLNTELKKLRKVKIQYENGSEELKRTITNISHDMRTPLTAIRIAIVIKRTPPFDSVAGVAFCVLIYCFREIKPRP